MSDEKQPSAPSQQDAGQNPAEPLSTNPPNPVGPLPYSEHGDPPFFWAFWKK